MKVSTDECTPDIKVSNRHVIAAFSELYESKHVILLQHLRKYERVVIIAVMIQSSEDKANLIDIAIRVKGITQNLGYDELNINEIEEILLRFQSFGLVNIFKDNKLDHIQVQPVLFADEIFCAYEKENCPIFERNKDYLKKE